MKLFCVGFEKVNYFTGHICSSNLSCEVAIKGGRIPYIILFLLINDLWLADMVDNVKAHKDSFGKSENLSKIFFTEILVFDHDYEGKSSSSNGLL